jgi:hypothetical protein
MNEPANQDVLWFTATGEEDEKPLIFRSRSSVPSGIVESDYPTRMTIFWEYEPTNDSGMPDEECNNAQVEIENALEELAEGPLSLLMLVVTGNGRKEWHWYVGDVAAWMNRLNDLLSEYPEYPIQIEDCQEPDWALYHNFITDVEGIE